MKEKELKELKAERDEIAVLLKDHTLQARGWLNEALKLFDEDSEFAVGDAYSKTALAQTILSKMPDWHARYKQVSEVIDRSN